MREHQIVITLKPEQFLEVQRLARAANAKSMGMFVRQKLLAALGIEGSLAPSQTGDAALTPQAVSQILTELHRLHAELRGFVAESVAHYSIEPIAEKEPGSSSATEEPAMSDDFEELAGRTFAISPRLGALESPQVVPESEQVDPLEAVPPLRDPLDVLLNEDSLRRLSKPDKPLINSIADEDDEEEYIPLSLRQKRSEKAESEKSGPTPAASVTAPATDDKAEDERESGASIAAAEDEDEEELPKPILREPPPQPPSGSGGNTQPFSGGPPPKRRKE